MKINEFLAEINMLPEEQYLQDLLYNKHSFMRIHKDALGKNLPRLSREGKRSGGILNRVFPVK